MAAPDFVPIRRAIVSVADKTGLVDRARALHAGGVELISTGGTKAALETAGIPARDASHVTDWPEMMDGRVKTLHPRIHGGVLARRGDAGDEAALAAHAIPAIDLVIVNLYAFEETVAAGGAFEACVEKIDIGGPALVRAGAKNHAHVAVCVDGEDLDAVLGAMAAHDGATPLALRRRLAHKAFARAAAYDAAISGWLGEQVGEPFADYAAFGGTRIAALRYGENPHQAAALYRSGPARPGVATARQLHGPALGYNNIQDADRAFELIAELDPADGAALAIVKHGNPCGVGQAARLAEAYEKAFRTDPVSPFGGVVAAGQAIDAATAEKIVALKTDLVIAPEIDPDALAVLAGRKSVRVLAAGGLPGRTPGVLPRAIAGGLLVQDRDIAHVDAAGLRIVTRRAPSQSELADMLFAWRVCKHVASNAVVFAKDRATAGIGGGQTSRVDAVKIAARKAEEAAELQSLPQPLTRGAACASDAFFPFADGLMAAAEAGATAVIQPGGSVRDEEVIAAADDAGLAMAFTGVRHFRH
ncbi:MAG: bifunctional phosphoribosylaminoimidazolecarboxamide formyltransferase/IMP cyclohydrolase [Caulobacterales bacterium]|nr:bifunctional phosphoribosylaminoimidazolecarboxamide formyltransferase/IMP cyclohydrolase [Caulobacterales bacterium]